MLDIIPTPEEMTVLVGASLYDIWSKLNILIDERYDVNGAWNNGGKA